MTRLDASNEPSMEDILASIRRIIAEQPGAAPPPAPPAHNEAVVATSSAGAGARVVQPAAVEPSPTSPTSASGLSSSSHATAQSQPHSAVKTGTARADGFSPSTTMNGASVADTRTSPAAADNRAALAGLTTTKADDLLAELKAVTSAPDNAKPSDGESNEAAADDAASLAAKNEGSGNDEADLPDDPFSFDLGPSPFTKRERSAEAASASVTAQPAQTTESGQRAVDAATSMSESESDETIQSDAVSDDAGEDWHASENDDDVGVEDASTNSDASELTAKADDAAAATVAANAVDSENSHDDAAKADSSADEDDGDTFGADPFDAVDAAASAAVAALGSGAAAEQRYVSRDAIRTSAAELRDDGPMPDRNAMATERPSGRARSVDEVLDSLRGGRTGFKDDVASENNNRYTAQPERQTWTTQSMEQQQPGYDINRPYTSRFSGPLPAPSKPYTRKDDGYAGYGFVPRPGNHRPERDILKLDDEVTETAARRALPDAVTEPAPTPAAKVDEPEVMEEPAAENLGSLATVVAQATTADDAAPGQSLTVSDPDQRALEDTVADLLRPMLKSWLAENMPKIVERALRREISELNLTQRKSAAE